MLHDFAVLFEQRDAFGEFLALQDDNSGQLGRDRRWRRDFVHHQAQGGGVYEVEHIVERGGQAVDVLAIERRDEALVEFGDDGVRSLVTFVFDGLHLIDPHGKIARVSENGSKQFGAVGEVAGKLSEEVEELSVAGD